MESICIRELFPWRDADPELCGENRWLVRLSLEESNVQHRTLEDVLSALRLLQASP